MKFRQLDTLRFILALTVAGGHLTNWWGVFQNGGLAVDFFFVLSGFVLAKSLVERPSSWPDFVVKRFARLWPLHVFAMAMILLTFSHPRLSHIAANLLLLQNAGIVDGLTLNFPAWSVSSEMLVGIGLIYPLARVGRSSIAIGIAVVCALTLLLSGKPHIEHLHAQKFGFLPFGIVRCALGAALGYLIYRLHARWALPAEPSIALDIFQIAVVATFFYTLMAISLGPVAEIGMIALAAIMIATCAYSGHFFTKFLGSNYVAWLGDISYGIYLLHIPLYWLFMKFGILPAETAIEKALENNAAGALYLPLALFLLVLIAVAYLAHRYVERLAQAWILDTWRKVLYRTRAVDLIANRELGSSPEA